MNTCPNCAYDPTLISMSILAPRKVNCFHCGKELCLSCWKDHECVKNRDQLFKDYSESVVAYVMLTTQISDAIGRKTSKTKL